MAVANETIGEHSGVAARPQEGEDDPHGSRRPVGEWRWLVAVAAVVFVGACIPLLGHYRFYFLDDTEASAYGVWYALGERISHGSMPLMSTSAWMSGNYAAEGQWSLWNPLMWLIGLGAYVTPNIAIYTTAVKVGFLMLAAMGAFLLAREYGARRELSFLAAVTVPFTGFTLYFDAASWVTGLICWSLIFWAWWAVRRMALAGAHPWPAIVLCYLVVTVGYVHGAIMLGVVIIATLVDALLQRRILGAVRLVALGAFSLLLIVTVFLPGALTADVTVRNSGDVVNDWFLAATVQGLAVSWLALARPQVRGWWGELAPTPIGYLSWLLPLYLLVDWHRARAVLRRFVGLAIIVGVALAVALGPSQLGPLRFPVRLMPYVAGGVLVLLAVLLSRASVPRPSRARLIAMASVVAGAAYLSWAQFPSQWWVVSLSGLLSVLGLGLLWWALGGGGDRRLRLSRRTVMLGVPVVVTIALLGAQAALFPASSLTRYHLSSWASDYKKQLPGAVDDVLVVGAPMAAADVGAMWSETLVGSAWYVNGASVQNGYTPIAYRTYAADLCMDWRGQTCPELLDRLFERDPVTRLPLVDELSINTLLILTEVVPRELWRDVPDGWHVGDVGTYSRTWVRDEPVARAGGVVWSTAGTEVSDVAMTDSRVTFTVDSVPASGATVVMSRLAWPGYRVSGAEIVDPVRDYLLTVHVDPAGGPQRVDVVFEPPGWAVERLSLIVAILGGLGWIVAATWRRRRVGV